MHEPTGAPSHSIDITIYLCSPDHTTTNHRSSAREIRQTEQSVDARTYPGTEPTASTVQSQTVQGLKSVQTVHCGWVIKSRAISRGGRRPGKKT